MDGPRSAIVFVGGGEPERRLVDRLPSHALVVAADSGLDLAHRLDHEVDIAVGDFDSASRTALERARAQGTAIERHPPQKDATDLELAIGRALAEGASEIVVVGGDGGRLDHTLGNVLALASDAFAAASLSAVLGRALLHVVRDRVVLQGEVGDLVTLLAAHGPASGVTTSGLLYPLRGAELTPGSSRGLSNQLVAREASVSVGSGVVLTVQPGEPGPPLDQSKGS